MRDEDGQHNAAGSEVIRCLTKESRLIDTRTAARQYGLSESWFEKARWMGSGYGPRYIKIGRAVRYDPADLKDFFESKKVS